MNIEYETTCRQCGEEGIMTVELGRSPICLPCVKLAWGVLERAIHVARQPKRSK